MRGYVWEVRSPDNPTSNEVKGKWDKLYKDSPRVLDIGEKNLKQRKRSTIAVVSSFLEHASLRTDVREMADLCLIFLGEEPPRGIH